MIFEDVLDMKELLYQLVSTVRLANITVTIELSLIDILRIIFEINAKQEPIKWSLHLH